MTQTPISLQDLRRRISAQATAEPSWRVWGLSVQVSTLDTLREAYRLAKEHNGAPGIDGVTLEAIEAEGGEICRQQLQDALVTRTYRPMRLRHKAIPQEGGTKVRVLSMPTSRDRVVQGACKLMLEPSVEADCQPGADGYRPKRSAHEAVLRVAEAIVQDQTRVIDVERQAYFDHIRHHLRLAQVAQRVKDPEGLHVRQLGLHASGTKGVAQGGVLSPLLRILSLPAVDRRLEQAQEVTRRGSSSSLDYARCAAALVSLGDASPPPDWLLQAVAKRLREEVATLPGASNEEKSRLVDLAHGEHCSFVGFEFRRVRRRRGGWRAW